MSDDLLSVEAFRRSFVEPMGEESDHVHIVALTNAIQASGGAPLCSNLCPASVQGRVCLKPLMQAAFCMLGRHGPHVAHTSELCRRNNTAGSRACLPLAPAENHATPHSARQSGLSPSPPSGAWSTKSKLPTCCMVHSHHVAVCIAIPAPVGVPWTSPPHFYHGRVLHMLHMLLCSRQ